MEKLGEGSTFKVYMGPDETKVIKVSKNEVISESPVDVKGRYYLTRVVHLLVPDFVPDVYLGSRNDDTTIIHAERIFPDTHYQRLSELIIKKQDKQISKADEEELYRLAATHRDRVLNDAHSSSYRRYLGKLGISNYLDLTPINIAFDVDGNPKYVDQIRPWDVEFGEVDHPNLSHIKAEMVSVLQGDVQTRALKLLARYEELMSEKVKEIQAQLTSNNSS